MRRQVVALLLGLVSSVGAHAATEEFPRPPELRAAVQFWITIYSDVPTTAGLLHDRDNLAVVYERITFREGATRAQRERRVRARKAHYREQLRAIARSDRDDLSARQREILSAWPEPVSDARLRQAARGIRFQLGQSDKFRAGLVRSGAWEPHIRRTLREMGLPQELAALPHVESSFNPDARSADGAAGIWQFTRATGQRYMRIDRIVDERLDPFKSSVAAAQLLRHNHSVTDSWALALTAYNHGLAGVRRAVRQVGSKDLGEIVAHYDGPNWGFASRNFYAAFLAAVEVDFNAHQYFGDLERAEPIVSEAIELPFFASAGDLAEALNVELERLRRLNQALREPVWSGRKRVPRGFALRLPAGPERPSAQRLIGQVERAARYYAQVPDEYHTVRRGEALSTIARRYGVSMHRLVTLNDLPSADYIRVGQTLRVPTAGEHTGHDPSDPVYTVRAGDTLSDIADRVGMSQARLAATNGIEDRDNIHPGQELRVDGQPAKGIEGPRVAQPAEPRGTVDGVTSLAAGRDEAALGFATSPDSAGVGATEASDGSTDGAQTVVYAGPQASRGAGAAPIPQRMVLGAEPATDAAEVADTQVESDAASSTFGADETAPTGQRGPELAADPADYAVAADGSIEIQAAETLGHYAEWLDLRASQLRRLNGMRYGEPVVIGNRLQLEFTRIPPERFEQRRLDYHEGLQSRFFEQFRIAGTERQVVQSGDSLWSLAQRADNVPVWLLRQYNPDLDFSELQPGMAVTLPQVQRQQQPSSTAGQTQAESREGSTSGNDA